MQGDGIERFIGLTYTGNGQFRGIIVVMVDEKEPVGIDASFPVEDRKLVDTGGKTVQRDSHPANPEAGGRFVRRVRHPV